MKSYDRLINLTEDKLIDIIKNSTSISNILENLDIHPKYQKCLKYLNKFIDDNNISRDHLKGKKTLINSISLKSLEVAVKNSFCWSDVLKEMNISFHGSRIESLRKIVDYYNIDYSHFNSKKAAVWNKTSNLKDDEIFVPSSNIHRGAIKKRLLNYKEYKCDICDNVGYHNEKPLTLQLDHINGIRNDNRLENLRFLCPNCHSQTATFTGKNNK